MYRFTDKSPNEQEKLKLSFSLLSPHDQRMKIELTLGETKCIEIIRNVIDTVAFDNLIEILSQQRFFFTYR